MILAIDIGNTNIVLGCADSDRILFRERLATVQRETSLEYAVKIKAALDINGIDRTQISGAVISSVVPSVTNTVKAAAEKLIDGKIMIVGPGIKTGLKIQIDNPAQLGSDLYRRSNGRIRSYHYYHPGKQAQSLAAMDRYVDDPAYVGIKIHPSWALTSADDERWRPVWEYAAAHRLPILAHTWDLSPTNPKQAYAFPARFEKFVREYPGVKLILAHSGGRCGGIRAAAALGQKYPNVYVDIAGDIWPNGFLEFMAHAIGAERILFGSDYTMMDQELMLGVVVGASLSIPEKENILYNNAKALFRL